MRADSPRNRVREHIVLGKSAKEIGLGGDALFARVSRAAHRWTTGRQRRCSMFGKRVGLFDRTSLVAAAAEPLALGQLASWALAWCAHRVLRRSLLPVQTRPRALLPGLVKLQSAPSILEVVVGVQRLLALSSDAAQLASHWRSRLR
jgi:hypothetical protein